MIAGVGDPVAGDEPSILVQDAITDTLIGVVVWDRKLDLEVHLRNVVRRRTSNRVKRARKQVRVSLEVFADEDGLAIAEAVDGHGARVPADASLERAQVVHQLCSALRVRAIGDAPMLTILDAYEADVFTLRGVMKLTGLSRAEFLNARRRLDRMLGTVPRELRSAALEVMRETPALTGDAPAVPHRSRARGRDIALLSTLDAYKARCPSDAP